MARRAPLTGRPATSGWSTVILDGHQFHRPSRTTVDGTSRVRTRNVSIRMPSASPNPMSRIWLPPDPPPDDDASTRNVPGQHQAGRGDGGAGDAQRAGYRLAQRQLVRLLPDPGHHQDVVVLAQRQQEDEHQERQEEHQAAAAAEIDEHRTRQAERGQVGDPDRGDQVERRDQAAQHDRQQQADDQDRNRDDLLEVAVRDALMSCSAGASPADARVGRARSTRPTGWSRPGSPAPRSAPECCRGCRPSARPRTARSGRRR